MAVKRSKAQATRRTRLSPAVKEPLPSHQVAQLIDKLRFEDFEPTMAAKPLSKSQVRAIVNMTHERALRCRKQNLWSPSEEAAFFNGIASAFHACGNAIDLPGVWFFCPPEGVLGVLAKEKAAAQAACEATDPGVGLLDAKTSKARKKAAGLIRPTISAAAWCRTSDRKRKAKS